MPTYGAFQSGGWILPVEHMADLREVRIHTNAQSGTNATWGGCTYTVSFPTEDGTTLHKDFFVTLGDHVSSVKFDGEYYTYKTGETGYVTATGTPSGELLYIVDPGVWGYDTTNYGDIEYEFLDYTLVYAQEEESQTVQALGDVNDDGAVNANDAALVLMAAARIGARQPSGLTQAQSLAANVDRDNDAVNANDAACILRYAAYRGARGEKDIYEYFGIDR